MNILTIGNSPYNNTSDSCIHRLLLKYLKKQGHDISAASWHHVESYYMREDDGKFYFDEDEERICEIISLPPDTAKVTVLYDYMKTFAPDVVISIGDYHEVDFIFAIKRMYPQLFKWISVLTIGSLPIKKSFKEALDYIDYAFLTSRSAWRDFSSLTDVPCEYLPFRPETGIVKNPELDDCFRVASCAKNSQQSNFGMLMETVAKFCNTADDIKWYIHTNVDDEGDYDLDFLRDRLSSQVIFPEKFVSFYDGVSHNELLEKFANADVFVDCSLTSATALTTYEACLQGCVPLVTGIGSNIDLLADLLLLHEFTLDSIEFMGEREGLLHIVDKDNIYRKLISLYGGWKKDKDIFLKLREKCQEKIKGLTTDRLVKLIEGKAVEIQKYKYLSLNVDFFGDKKDSA